MELLNSGPRKRPHPLTGMSRSAINRYEKGKLMPTVRAMNKLLVPVGYRLAIVPLEEDKEEQDEENIDL